MVKAYELANEQCDYPLHLGVTEAGTERMGIIKSAAGIGSLLLHGIGDTIRVSLTADPVKEIYAANDILKALGLKKSGVQFVSCPTCGRTEIDLISLATEVEKRVGKLDRDITVAVMGCVVNGPGEAREADYGIAGGKDCGLLFRRGEILGIAGISGCGQKELLEAIAGLQPAEGGSVCYVEDDGTREELLGKDPLRIAEMGVALSFVPEDRLGMGLVGSMGMTDNMMLKSYDKGSGFFTDAKPPRTLAQEMVFGLKTPFWGMKVNPRTIVDEVIELAPERSFAGLYAGMHLRFAQYVNKPRWGEKTPHNLYFVGPMHHDFPNAQFIYITRDGRDASVDYMESSFGPTNIYCAAQSWKRCWNAVKEWREPLREKGLWLDVRYEELVREPEKVMRGVCEFLGEDFEEGMFEFYKTDMCKARGASRDHAPLGKPISDKYVGIHKDLLSLRDHLRRRSRQGTGRGRLHQYGGARNAQRTHDRKIPRIRRPHPCRHPGWL